MKESVEDEDGVSIENGDTVYDDQGHVVGIVRGASEDGFDVEVVDGGADVSSTASTPGERDSEDIPGKEFGEGYLMWRCEECGAMGELDDGIPESCPDCYAPKEYIENVQED